LDRLPSATRCALHRGTITLQRGARGALARNSQVFDHPVKS
jgi:hypothetical protein